MRQKGGNIEIAREQIKKWLKMGIQSNPLDLSELNLVNLTPIPDSVEILICSNNKLKDFKADIGDKTIMFYEYLPKNLKELHCFNNNLIHLPRLPDSLTVLVCNDNKLIDLPELPNNLKQLICYNNKLRSLPKLPDNLEDLDCNDNELPDFLNIQDDELDMGLYIKRIKEIQKTRGNLSKNIKGHSLRRPTGFSVGKRETHSLNPISLRNITGFLNYNDLKKMRMLNKGIYRETMRQSLKPSNVEINVYGSNKSRTRRHLRK